MKKNFAIWCVVILLISLIAGLTIAYASENYNDSSIITAEDTIDGDYIKASNSIFNKGRVTGDFIVAGNDITNEGIIGGDLIAAAAEITHSGKVSGDTRIVAGDIFIEGEVSRNASMIGNQITQYKDSNISGSIHVLSRDLEIRGFVGGDIKGANENTIISGTVKGNVFLHTSNISILPDAIIEGDLVYISETQQSINPQQVKGRIEHRYPKGASKDFANQVQSTIRTASVITRLGYLLSFLLAGIVLILLFKKPYERASLLIQERPWYSIGLGVSIIICVPIVAIILMITIIGIPFGVIALALYGILLYTAKIPVGIWLGSKIFRGEKRLIIWFIIGTLILEAVSLIPLIGWLASFVTLAIGTGSTMIMLKRYYKHHYIE